jgi:phospholipid transport system substrate-binding protein
VVAASGFLLAASGVPPGASPRELVRSLTDAVIAVLRDPNLDARQKRSRIEEIVFDHVDFETMSRLVLAQHWRGLDEAHRRAFVEEFRRHLSVTYGKNVESYQNETVTITGDREEARGDWTVQTRIVRNGPNDILVDYRLRRIGGEWKIIDVVIERVSLVSNFRSQFQSILTSGGIDRLLELLRQKNEAGESGLRS